MVYYESYALYIRIDEWYGTVAPAWRRMFIKYSSCRATHAHCTCCTGNGNVNSYDDPANSATNSSTNLHRDIDNLCGTSICTSTKGCPSTFPRRNGTSAQRASHENLCYHRTQLGI